MKRKKRAVTLIEIMIVILIIGLISGVLAYNFKGSLDKGKIFKSEQGANQIKSILMMELADGQNTSEYIKDHWQEVITASPFVSKPEQLVKDGWGESYKVSFNNDEFEVTSPGLEKHNAQKAQTPAKKA